MGKTCPRTVAERVNRRKTETNLSNYHHKTGGNFRRVQEKTALAIKKKKTPEKEENQPFKNTG